MITTDGLGLTEVEVAADVAEQPLELVTVTVNVPELPTVMDCVVAPLLHNQEDPAEAVSTTLFPEQKVVGPPAVIFAAGTGFTVTVVGAEVPVHPPVCVTTTVYVPDVVTFIDCVVAPVLQVYVEPVFAVSVTLPPLQKVVGPLALIVAGGAALIVSVTAVRVLLSQPLAVLRLAAWYVTVPTEPKVGLGTTDPPEAAVYQTTV